MTTTSLPAFLARLLLGLGVAAVTAGLFLGTPGRLHAQSGPDDAPAGSAADPTHDSANNSANDSSKTDESAGDTPTTGDYYFSDAHRREMYDSGRLRFSKAALLNLAVPGLGNFYARQFFVGGLAVTLMAFSAVFMTFGATYRDPTYVWVGVGVLGVIYPGSIATSYFGVKKYNRELRESLRIDEARSRSRGRGLDDHRFMRQAPRFRGVNINIRF